MGALTDNFDSYSDGDLNGQGSWSGHTSYDIQGTVTQTGSGKAVAHTTSGDTGITKTFTSSATGIQQVYGRVSSTTDAVWQVRLREGATPLIYIKTNGGNLQYFNGTSYVTIGAISVDTWFQVEVQWDASTDQARYRLNGGSWTSYANFNGTISSGIDTVHLLNDGASAANSYWDTLADTGGSASLSPSISPSLSPSISPSQSPSASLSPSRSPSLSPSISPSQSPSASLSPSLSPSRSPSLSPSLSPSISPSQSPSASLSPSLSPSISPSQSPSASLSPSLSPSISPSVSPSIPPERWTYIPKQNTSWVSETRSTADWVYVPK